MKCGPHTSVILTALGSLSSVALSSVRMKVKYQTKRLMQGLSFNLICYGEMKTGILIVVEGK